MQGISYCQKHKGNKLAYEKSHEISVIVYSNAVVYPRTVVVIAFHTFIADIAMTRSEGPNDLTVRAKQSWVKNH